MNENKKPKTGLILTVCFLLPFAYVIIHEIVAPSNDGMSALAIAIFGFPWIMIGSLTSSVSIQWIILIVGVVLNVTILYFLGNKLEKYLKS